MSPERDLSERKGQVTPYGSFSQQDWKLSEK